ncbi:MAG: hypothetical protein ABL894_04250 [Hyphomicrobium sp.]
MNRLFFFALTSAGLIAAGAAPGLAQDAPTTVQSPVVTTLPLPAVAAPSKAPDTAKDAAKAAAPVKVTKPKINPPAANAAADAPETLPWAAGTKPTPGAKPAAGKTADKAKPAAAAAEGTLKMPCPGLYEAACREVPACTWIADVKLQTGADVKAHCVDRNPKGSKDAAKKATDKKSSAAAVKPKPAASASVAAPAVVPGVTDSKVSPPSAAAPATAPPAATANPAP